MVVVHPEYAYLILDLNDLKEEIADLIVERDLLLNYVCIEIQMDYMLKIGALEYKLLICRKSVSKKFEKIRIDRREDCEKAKGKYTFN